MEFRELFRLPWARRVHEHSQYVDRLSALVHDNTCHGCGHLVLSEHVSVWRVSIHDSGISHGRVYGVSCRPNYNHVESTPDEKWRYYLKNENGAMMEVLEPSEPMDELPKGPSLQRRIGQ